MCHTRSRVKSHMGMSYVTHEKESWHTQDRVWHSYVWYGSFLRVAWLNHMKGMTHSYQWHDWLFSDTTDSMRIVSYREVAGQNHEFITCPSRSRAGLPLCCSMFQCAACVAVCRVAVCHGVLQCVAVCCSVLQCVAVCCNVLQCGAVCCSVLQYVTVYCSILQCVGFQVRCSVLHLKTLAIHHGRRRSDFKKYDCQNFHLPKFPTSLNGSPHTHHTCFHGSPHVFIQFFTRVNGSPSLERSIGKPDRSRDPKILSLLSSVRGKISVVICFVIDFYKR